MLPSNLKFLICLSDTSHIDSMDIRHGLDIAKFCYNQNMNIHKLDKKDFQVYTNPGVNLKMIIFSDCKKTIDFVYNIFNKDLHSTIPNTKLYPKDMADCLYKEMTQIMGQPNITATYCQDKCFRSSVSSAINHLGPNEQSIFQNSERFWIDQVWHFFYEVESAKVISNLMMQKMTSNKTP